MILAQIIYLWYAFVMLCDMMQLWLINKIDTTFHSGYFNVCIKRCILVREDNILHNVQHASLRLESGALNMNLFSIFLVFTILSVSAEKSNLDDPVLFCDGCFAMVSEIEKDMSVRSRVHNLTDNLSSKHRISWSWVAKSVWMVGWSWVLTLPCQFTG